jgi:arginase
MSRFDLVGVPSSMAAFAPGQERAPAALRAAGLAEALRDSGSDVRDLGDAPTRRWRPDRDHPRAQNVEAVTEVVRETAERLGQTTESDAVAIVLGGDCTVGLGTVAAYRARGRVRLIYFDLHPDMNVPSSVPEGALDWMGTAHALGIDGTEPALVEVGPVAPLLRPDELWLFAYGPKNRTAFERE